MLYICTKCKVILKCIKNNVGCDFGNGNVYASDAYQCPECLNSIVSTNHVSSYDIKRKYFDLYLSMNSNQIKEVSEENIQKALASFDNP